MTPGGSLDASMNLDNTGNGMTVKFPRAPFGQRPAGTYALTLLGQRTDGVVFRGSTTLEVSGTGALSRLKAPRGHSGVVITLDQPEVATLDVIDLQGRVVSRLATGMLSGTSIHEWPRAGESVARGSYFVRLRREHQKTEVVKLTVLP